MLVGLSVVTPFPGGVLWQYLCKLYGWPFHLGRAGNEPYGLFAMTWGVVTMLPVFFSSFGNH